MASIWSPGQLFISHSAISLGAHFFKAAVAPLGDELTMACKHAGCPVTVMAAHATDSFVLQIAFVM